MIDKHCVQQDDELNDMKPQLKRALLLVQDRAASGLHPISPDFHSFDCFDTGIDHGGTGKVFVTLTLRDRTTGQTVLDATQTHP
ncbi:MAG: hypothetical protein AAF414_20445 [Pseudomonadota bacterium]